MRDAQGDAQKRLVVWLSYNASVQDRDDWKWHYSRIIGIMYGPVPVGILVVVVVGIFYLASL